MVAIGSTVTVFNKSGKVVKNSKHIANVFKEAKSAYLERKAELKTTREDELSRKSSTHASDADSRTDNIPPRPTYIEDGPRSSRQSSRRSSHDHGERRRSRRRDESDHSHHRSRPPPERGYSDSFYANDHPTSTRGKRTTTTPLTASNLRHASVASSTSPSSPTFSRNSSYHNADLLRRHSDTDITSPALRPTRSTESLDSGLAYGELPPPLPVRRLNTETEIRTKMSALQKMLQEANCVQYSAKAVIKNLEENPDAMAAVALTLAEISNMATKMAPGALMALKGTFPMVIALLLSPEFLIAGGVALGVTVVSFGGYKIVKKLKLKKKNKQTRDRAATEGEESEEEEEEEELELEQLGNLDRIEQWRRGLELPPGVDTQSIATSVEGEYVTPKAAKTLREEGVLDAKSVKTTWERGQSKDEKKTSKEKPKEKQSSKSKAKDLAAREKELEKKEKELAKKEREINKAVERNEKLERKATVSANKKAEMPKKEQKQITEYGEDDVEKPAKDNDMQKILKTIFSKKEKKEEVRGEIIA